MIVDTNGQKVDLQSALSKLAYVDEVSEPVTGKTKENLQMYEVNLVDNPYSVEAMAEMPKLQKQVTTLLCDAGVEKASEHVWIGGETAAQYDTKLITQRDESVIMPTMIAIIA